jgi:hypothetical protein
MVAMWFNPDRVEPGAPVRCRHREIRSWREFLALYRGHQG